MYQIVLAFSCCVLLFCAENSSVSEQNNSGDAERLKHVRSVFGTYPKISFPFHRVTESDEPGYPKSDLEKDTLIFGEEIVSIVGTIPDTSQYFGFFYIAHADELCLGFAAIDKSGSIVERKLLVSGGWKGRESDNRSFVDISEDLMITFDYSEFYYDDESEDDWHVPFDASGHVTRSRITSSGKIEEIERIEKDPAELLKDPILH